MSSNPSSNVSQSPVVRKLEQKVQAVEKKIIETEAHVAELTERLHAAEVLIAKLLRQQRLSQHLGSSLPMEPLPTATDPHPQAHFMAPPSLGAAARAAVVQVEVDADPEDMIAPPAPQGMSLAKLDVHLSNLGIRLIEDESDDEELRLEPMNAWGREHLAKLGTVASRVAVEEFIRMRGDMA